MVEFKVGDRVRLVNTDDLPEIESENWIAIESLDGVNVGWLSNPIQIGDKFTVEDVKPAKGEGYIELEELVYAQPAERFEKI